MTEHTTPEPAPGASQDRTLSQTIFNAASLFQFLFLAAFVCASFSAVAQWTVCIAYGLGTFTEEPGFLLRQFLKGAGLCAIALGSAWAVWRASPRRDGPLRVQGPAEKPSRLSTAVLVGALLLAALVAFPRLSSFPGAAPDELHHLIVARNLAESGAYASGHPASGLVYFDYYDSVGPTVLGPVAGAFRLLGTELWVARLPIALSFIALCILAYLFAVRVFSHLAASIGVLALIMAFGSGYLSRTLYGEVPALALFLAGLLCWRRALDAPDKTPMGLWAGFFFGLAVLTKTFFLVSGFAFAGSLLYAWVRGRRLGWRPVVLPLVTLVAVMGLWKIVEIVWGDPNAESVSAVVYYRHWLLFSWRPSWTGLSWIAGRPVTAAVAILALVTANGHMNDRGFDPALGVLVLMAVLFGFWWLCFTPGHIPRYMWYGMAIAGLCSGHLVVQSMADLRRPQLGTKILAFCVVVGVLGSGLWRTAGQLHRTYTRDEVSDEYNLAQFVKTLPADAKIGTTFWPVVRSLNFFAGRTSKVIGEAAPESLGFDVVIYDGKAQEIPEEILKASRRIGRYVIVADEV